MSNEGNDVKNMNKRILREKKKKRQRKMNEMI